MVQQTASTYKCIFIGLDLASQPTYNSRTYMKGSNRISYLYMYKNEQADFFFIKKVFV